MGITMAAEAGCRILGRRSFEREDLRAASVCHVLGSALVMTGRTAIVETELTDQPLAVERYVRGMGHRLVMASLARGNRFGAILRRRTGKRALSRLVASQYGRARSQRPDKHQRKQCSGKESTCPCPLFVLCQIELPLVMSCPSRPTALIEYRSLESTMCHSEVIVRKNLRSCTTPWGGGKISFAR